MMKLEEPDVEALARKLVARHGSGTEAAIEQHVARARRSGEWARVTFWCRVKWRARLVQRRLDRGALPRSGSTPNLALTCP